MACREVVELVTEYLDGAMSWRGRRSLERHLRGCRGCRPYLEQMRETIRLTGRLSQESLPAEVREAVLTIFRSRASTG
jgi:predicted anti-sigma-YlaC factor YlaD